MCRLGPFCVKITPSTQNIVPHTLHIITHTKKNNVDLEDATGRLSHSKNGYIYIDR